MKDTETIDIGILTIREDEFDAILGAFPESPDSLGWASGKSGRRQYALRTLTLGAESYRIAILRQIEEGNGEAQAAARDLIDDWEPVLLIVAGIAGGFPSEDFTLGDVIVSSRVVDFTVSAKKAEERPTYSGTGGPITPEISGTLANLRAREEVKDWNSGLDARPQLDFGSLSTYGPDDWQAVVAETLTSHRSRWPGKPNYKIGFVASSDTLVKDPEVVIPLLEANRKLLAVEMEAGGVYRASQGRCPMIAIRGISDIIGLKRADSFTKFACLSAAAFCKAYLMTQPVAPKRSFDKKKA